MDFKYDVKPFLKSSLNNGQENLRKLNANNLEYQLELNYVYTFFYDIPV